MLRFDDFTLDSEARTLVRAGALIPLGGKALQLLEILVDHRPKVVTKARLQALLWPETYVTEASLHSLVSEVRSALGDGRHEPRFIRTVHGYGYAFCGEVAADTRPRLVSGCSIFWGNREVPLNVGENVLGRDPDVAVCVAATTVSRRHARIFVGADEVLIEDLDSKNGTAVGGAPLDGPRALRHGDEIRLGSVHLTFCMAMQSTFTHVVTAP